MLVQVVTAVVLAVCAISTTLTSAAAPCTPAPCVTYDASGTLIGGESTLTIEWNVEAGLPNIFIILGSLDQDGATLQLFLSGEVVLNHTLASPATTGSYNWDIPYIAEDNLQILLQIAPDNTRASSFVSGDTFSTEFPPFAVTSPRAYSFLIPGEDVTIKWQNFDGNDVKIQLVFRTSEGDLAYPYSLFGDESTPNSGSATYTVPSIANDYPQPLLYTHNIYVKEVDGGTDDFFLGPLFVPAVGYSFAGSVGTTGRAVQGTNITVAYTIVNFADEEVAVTISNATSGTIRLGALPNNFAFNDSSHVATPFSASATIIIEPGEPLGTVTVRLYVERMPAISASRQITVLPPCEPGTFYNDTDVTCNACPPDTFTDTINQDACQPHSTCPDGWVVAAAGTSTADTLCVDPAITLPIRMAAAAPPGLLFAASPSDTTSVSDNTTVTSRSLLTVAARDSPVSIHSALGNKQATASITGTAITATAPTATRVRAVLLGEPGLSHSRQPSQPAVVLPDETAVKVLLFALDGRGLAMQDAECHVRIQDNAQQLTAVTAVCTTSSSSPTPSCTATLALPSSYFTAVHQLTLTAGPNATAAAEETADVAATLQTAQRVARPEPLTGDVLAVFPQRPLPRSKTFTLTVSAHGGARPLSSWQLRVTSPDANTLQVQSVTGGSGWTVTASSLPSRDVAVLGVRAIEQGGGGGAGAEESVLFTADVLVGAMAARDVVLNVSVVEAFDSSGQPVLSGTAPLVVASSNPNPTAHRTSTVSLTTYNEADVVALHAFPSMRTAGAPPTTAPLSNVLLNTAALNPDNAALQHPLTVSAYSASGSGTTLSPSTSLVCSSSAPEALQVDASCGYVHFTGAETAGSDSAQVVVQHATLPLNTTLRYKVWHPAAFRIAIDVQGSSSGSDVVLRRIGGTALYQHVGYTIEADWSSATAMTSGGADDWLNSTDVTEEVWPLLQGQHVGGGSGDGNVIVTPLSITTNTSGTFRLCISHPLRTPSCLGARDIEATDSEPATPVAISATVVASVTAATTTSSADTYTRVSSSFTSVLTADQQSASVVVHAIFSDGSTRVLDPALHNTTVTTGSPALIATNINAASSNSHPFVTTLGGGSVAVGLTWYVSDTTTVHGTVDVVSALPAVTGVRVAGLPAAMAPSTDVSSQLPANLASSTLVSVFLQYDDGTEIDFTTDARTNIATEGNITATVDGTRLRVAVADGSTEGQARLLVSFEHTGVTASLAVEVVVATGLRVALRPFPAFPGSEDEEVAEVRRLGASNTWQQAMVDVSAVLSSGEVVSGNDHAELMVSTPAFFNYNSNTRLVSPTPQLPGDEGMAVVVATLRDLFNTTAVTVSSLAWGVASITPVLPATTLAGTVNTKQQMRASVVMENGLTLTTTYLFPNGGALALPNLITFDITTPTATDAVVIDSATGTATLTGNSRTQETLAVYAGDNADVNATALFYVNLVPTNYDVDLGATQQLPLAPVTGGDTVAISVRVRLPSTLAFASISLQVTFDDAVLEFVDVAEGSDWPGGEFAGGLDGSGRISFGGSTAGVGPGTLTLFEVTLRVKGGAGAGFSSVSGTAVTIADGDGTLLASDVPFVAGDVTLEITAPARRRRSHQSASATSTTVARAFGFSSTTASRARRAECGSPPCAVCMDQRQIGDADGNCLFDVRDVTFLKRFLNERLLDPDGAFVSAVQAFQMPDMDADGNTIINTVDVNFLLRANFGLFALVRSVNMTAPDTDPSLAVSVEQTECSVAVYVQTISGGDGREQVPSDPQRTAVFVYLDSPNVTLHNNAQLVVTDGEVVVADVATNQRGVFIKAAHDPARDAFFVAASSELPSDLVLTGVPLLISIDAAGETNADRATAALTYSDAPVSIAGEQRVAFTFLGQGFELVLNDYGPRVWVSTTTVSRNCREQLMCDDEAGEYVAVNATTTDNPVCRALTTCVLGDSYETRAPTQFSDRVCANTTVCTPGQEYISVLPTLVSDRRCSNISAPCTSTQFEAMAPTNTSDRVCTNTTVCDLSTQYIVTDATLSSNRVCANISDACVFPLQFEIQAPTNTSDRACVTTLVCTASQYETVAPTPTSNRECTDLHTCNLDEYAIVPPTPTTNRVCELATVCDDTEFESVELTPTSDRQCMLNPCNVSTICLPEGSCIPTATGPYCDCPPGIDCGPTQPPTTDACAATVCSDEGMCVSTSSGAFCVCPDSAPNCGPTTAAPDLNQSSDSSVDASLVAIATSCSFVGLLLVLGLVYASRFITCDRRKSKQPASVGGVQVFEQEGFEMNLDDSISDGDGDNSRARLDRQVSVRTRESVETFKPLTLGRMDSFEETPFEAQATFEGGPEDGGYSALPHQRLTANPAYEETGEQAKSNFYEDVGPAEGSGSGGGGGYQEVPRQRLTANPAYETVKQRPVSMENQYSDVGAGHYDVPHVKPAKETAEGYDLPRKTPRWSENQYEDISAAPSRQTKEGDYDRPHQPSEGQYASVSGGAARNDGDYDRKPYMPNAVLYDELPGKSRRNSVVADVPEGSAPKRRRSTRVLKLSEDVLRDPERDVFFVKATAKNKQSYGGSKRVYKAMRFQGAANEAFVMPEDEDVDGDDADQQQRPAYFDPKATRDEKPAYFDPKATRDEKLAYFDPKATRDEKPAYFDPVSAPPNPDYASPSAVTPGYEYGSLIQGPPGAEYASVPAHDEGEYMELSREDLLANPMYASFADLEETTHADDANAESYLTIVPSKDE
ncbi:hypothetical protein PTSG_07261 [Salpingoeca rosetta]|uniref:GPS domain-containing protein n=1 Tax=Salpingoeca rosetta (strain ATCC 50818 / BSB-021) TaxID=946362 RepID=F2UEI6_SALR5|nr:uncharacterized protein PTSG_07261 [Salpingoeca rosetta]EGD75036.1 hypothetical protein PTSG_07261 [Salpingoeca rosetta]|eukprot:XP_004992680.1 hypothetical protein PTSG_07261 [Salpingoeca rosetta]